MNLSIISRAQFLFYSVTSVISYLSLSHWLFSLSLPQLFWWNWTDLTVLTHTIHIFSTFNNVLAFCRHCLYWSPSHPHHLSFFLFFLTLSGHWIYWKKGDQWKKFCFSLLTSQTQVIHAYTHFLPLSLYFSHTHIHLQVAHKTA